MKQVPMLINEDTKKLLQKIKYDKEEKIMKDLNLKRRFVSWDSVIRYLIKTSK